MKNYFFVVILFIGFLGCIGGGTHGSIKAYIYNVPKRQLERAVHQVLLESDKVAQDSIKDYYNDDTNYISIRIITKGLPYTYTFKFGGSSQYWDTSRTSSIFIAYAYDEKRRGGSSGNGGVRWYDFKLKKELTEPFDLEFINKVDQELRVTHTEEYPPLEQASGLFLIVT